MINILLIKIILNRLKNYILEVIVKIIMLVELFLKIIILKLGEVNLEKGVIRNYDCKSDYKDNYKGNCRGDYKGNYRIDYRRDYIRDCRIDYRRDFGSNYKSDCKRDFGNK